MESEVVRGMGWMDERKRAILILDDSSPMMGDGGAACMAKGNFGKLGGGENIQLRLCLDWTCTRNGYGYRREQGNKGGDGGDRNSYTHLRDSDRRSAITGSATLSLLVSPFPVYSWRDPHKRTKAAILGKKGGDLGRTGGVGIHP